MAKVFRLHQGIDGTGWFKSSSITKDQLETIKTEGKDAATSIPSPFARIDLFKSAFAWVAENNIEGSTAHHKLVSDALDIAQIFYSIHKYSNNLEITAWNPGEQLKKLSEQNYNSKHKKFGETLKLYWEQDCTHDNDNSNVLYNFEHVNRIYLLINKATNQVLGGTSPITLFFAAPDAREVAKSLNIIIAQDKLFDDIYTSLATREPSFIEYIYALAKQPHFADRFPEFFAYIEKVRLEHLPYNLKTIVSALTEEAINLYPVCPVLGNTNNFCEILDMKLRCSPLNRKRIESESDFTIRPEIEQKDPLPLILPDSTFRNKWTYTTKGTEWNEHTVVPARNDESPDDSVLPDQGDKYYWLSAGNFLEDKIIRLPYSIDSSKFETCGVTNWLLPLTPTFFKYFKAENITKYLTLEVLAAGGVKAELEIPVRGGSIKYKKIYDAGEKSEVKIHLALLPFVKTTKILLDYTIGIIDDRDDRRSGIGLICYRNNYQVKSGTPVVRRPGDQKDQKSLYFKVEREFDRLQLIIDEKSGFLIPKLRECNGSKDIHFAVDFGTTNTHIEYRTGSDAPVAFGNEPEFPLWKSLFDWKDKDSPPELKANERIFDSELIPYSFSDRQNFSYPVRTALLHNMNIDFNNSLDVFCHANNFLLYEKRFEPTYLELRTKQLKWSNYSDLKDLKIVECYIEFLLISVLYKSLLLGGNPDQTRITWFYPVSMGEHELGVLFQTWARVYKKVFKHEPEEERLNGIPESVAPYLYYKGSTPGLSLSIDIGGGSSDLAVFDESESSAKFISSFKFAGNAIFGDGLGNDSENNGFVKLFLQIAAEAVKKDTQKQSILRNILNARKDSADFSSFLFSLENDAQDGFNYTLQLQKEHKIKLLIIIFFSAIAYYSAKLLSKSGIDIPKNIMLSGTAAKTALIIDPTNTAEFRNLSGMFQFIFEKVYNGPSANGIKVKLSEIPKEITCKGALKGQINRSIIKNSVRFWVGGKEESIMGGVFDREEGFDRIPFYRDVDDKAEESLRQGLNDFYSILDAYVGATNIESKYGIEPEAYNIFRQMRENDVTDFLKRGMKEFHKNANTRIEETLFFYPLLGILNKLGYELSIKAKH